MQIVCTKKCLDKDNKPFIVGNIYTYYESKFIFDSMNNKIYDIFAEIDGEEIYMGNGSEWFIKDNFYIKDEVILNKIICNNTCSGPNGYKYIKDMHYYYCLKQMKYVQSDVRYYSVFDSDTEFIGYVKLRFINRNFTKWNDYVEDFLKIDELFETILDA